MVILNKKILELCDSDKYRNSETQCNENKNIKKLRGIKS
jgi:hypothetical protein